MGRLPAAVFVCVLAACPAMAGHLVVFGDGRSLPVEGFRFEDDRVRLDLEGGGGIVVPISALARIERSPDAAPVAPEPLPVEDVEALARTLGRDEGWRAAAGRFADLIAEAAVRHELDPWLLAAVAKVESNFDPYAVSHAGACGLLQLMPATAKRFGVTNVFDATENVHGGARYLRWLLDRFEGRRDLALAAYNAGEGAVDRYGGIPPYRETLNYVGRVLRKAARPEPATVGADSSLAP
jgi:soluble lytic murein transglycosylase-like protein